MPTAAEFRKAAEYLREKPFPVQVREVCALLLAAAAQSEASEDDRLVLAAVKPGWLDVSYAAILDAARMTSHKQSAPGEIPGAHSHWIPLPHTIGAANSSVASAAFLMRSMSVCR